MSISGEHGAIPRLLFLESIHKPLAQLTTYEAILRYYEYDLQPSFETMSRAQETLERAMKIAPSCGVIWTMLARIYGDWISYGLADPATAMEKVLAFAEKGVFLHPENPRAWLILGYARFLDNDLAAAREEIDRAAALNPTSLYFLDAIGYMYTLLGEWELGTALILKAIQCNPHHRHFVYYGLWLNSFRQEKYEEALRQTQNFRLTGNYWDLLAQAATLGHLGRIEEGKLAAGKLLDLNPRFLAHGRSLIMHFIKLPDIAERVIAGLRAVGIPVQ
jgi:tetratricopeptide (TPR) repeat protein